MLLQAARETPKASEHLNSLFGAHGSCLNFSLTAEQIKAALHAKHGLRNGQQCGPKLVLLHPEEGGPTKTAASDVSSCSFLGLLPRRRRHRTWSSWMALFASQPCSAGDRDQLTPCVCSRLPPKLVSKQPVCIHAFTCRGQTWRERCTCITCFARNC